MELSSVRYHTLQIVPRRFDHVAVHRDLSRRQVIRRSNRAFLSYWIYSSWINRMSSLNSYEPSTMPPTTADNSPLSFTILWSPLPPITWILPFIGHMGIATSRGVACDFQGPYAVGERGRMVSLLKISRSTLCANSTRIHYSFRCNFQGIWKANTSSANRY